MSETVGQRLERDKLPQAEPAIVHPLNRNRPVANCRNTIQAV
ncbi:hypothetical protein [Neisseria elongata]